MRTQYDDGLAIAGVDDCGNLNLIFVVVAPVGFIFVRVFAVPSEACRPKFRNTWPEVRNTCSSLSIGGRIILDFSTICNIFQRVYGNV